MKQLLEQKTPLALVLLSLVFTFARSGPLNGSTAALVLVVVLQVYLPGYLFATSLGKLSIPHPILRFSWVLVCGLSLTIVLGGFARLLHAPVPVYLLLLHGLMLLLLWLGGAAPAQSPWRLTKRNLPLYLVVAVACVVVMAVSYASRYRFYGFEDQVIFAANIEWLVHNPGEDPLGYPLRSRQAGVLPTMSDTRHDTDGWTYNHAAWVWSSGVSAAQLIWYDLNPLFVWTAPLVIFGLAYTLLRREEAAAWSAAGLTIAGLLTLDNIASYPGYTSFGRFSAFQINVLRQMAITLMLPLSLMVGMTYLRLFRKRDLFMLLLAGTALAMVHPILIMVFLLALGVTVVIRWLMKPNRRRLYHLLPLAPVFVLLMVLPFIQRLNRSGLGSADSVVRLEASETADTISVVGEFLFLPNLPLVGQTFIRNPQTVFYHPVIMLAVVLGLLYLLRLRRSLAAQYFFGTTLLVLVLFFVPGLTAFYNSFVSSVGVLTTIFVVPVALILGFSLDKGLRLFHRRYPTWPVSLILLAAAGLLWFEPFPIAGSSRDQIQSYNEMQQIRRIHPAHTALVDSLRSLLPDESLSIVMAPTDSVNFVIEELPRSLITGGRPAGNRARFGDNRFYNLADATAPWLDAEDLDFMEQWGVTHVILRADHARLPQVLLQPQRFSLLEVVMGQYIFAVNSGVEVDAVDGLYAQMNALYVQTSPSRWTPAGFALARPGDTNRWQPLIQDWTDLLDEQPDNDRARLGLAYTQLMMGADDEALPLWRSLHETHPDVPFFTDALAYSEQISGHPETGAEVLLAALESESPETRVMAARSLLSETFFYRLGEENLERILDTSRSDADTWDYLIFFDNPTRIRQQASLLMTAQRWEAVIDWLDHLPQIEVSPRDITAQAAALLAQAKVDEALTLLQNTTDPDWRKAKAFWHEDRWQNNQAAQLYYLLSGDVAVRDGRLDDAVRAYETAVAEGVTLPGRYFLAQTLEAKGEVASAQAVRDQLETEWEGDQPFPQLLPILAMADTGNPFVMQPQVTEDESGQRLNVTAAFGDFQPHQGYPVNFWRIEVVSPDASIHYAQVDAPPRIIENAVVHQSISLDLPDDLGLLSPARVFITPAHSNAVTMPPATLSLTLNRPKAATVPPDAVPLEFSFGDAITLESYVLDRESDQLNLTLYWQTREPLAEDYQVFVHVVDENGEMIAQDDTAPVRGQYPTSQWRTTTVIADPHTLPVDSLPPHFSIRVGLYRLPDSTRLPVTPSDERVQDNSILIYES